MRKFLVRVLALALVVTIVSCRKYNSPTYPPTERKIRFQLYTNQNFADDRSVIHFSIFIRKANQALFDSALATMQIKDIPDANHKIIIEKTLPANTNVDVAAGFNYEIENVGISWYTDTSKAGNPLKVIDYAFQ